MMKVLRVIGNILVGIILFALLFAFMFISKTKNLLEGDLLKDTIRNTVEEISKNDNSLTESQKEVIDDMFKDSDVSGIINMILDNYKEYRNDSNYSVSYTDAKKLYDFLVKYKSYIKSDSNEDISKMTEQQFKEYFDNKKVDEFTINAFKEFDKNFDQDTLNIALDAYSFATSAFVRAILVVTIIVFILLLCLINWDFIKWMLVFGIDLIVSGTLFIILYFLAELVKDRLLKETAKINFNFTSFLVSGIIQVVIGIVLIVLYVVLEKKFKKKDKNVIKERKIETT